MPFVEVLPNTANATSAPGWAYVPDTGYDPSKAALVPSGARNRAKQASGAASGQLSVRQQNRIGKRIAELDRDNRADVLIVVPNRPSNVALRGLRPGNMTPGVKKILLSQKTFANHLADEEAAIALQQSEGAPRSSLQRPPSGKGPTHAGPGRPRGSLSKRMSTSEPMVIDEPEGESAATEVADVDEFVNDPFLASGVPPPPSAAEIEALLSAAPLSYNAARAGPTKSTAPPRQFCDICGYWGRVRCMKCGSRVCDLECLREHEAMRCQKF